MTPEHVRSVPRLLADPVFAALKALIVERTGHHYYADKDEQLGERIAKRMVANRLGDAKEYLERLNDTVLGDHEWRQLESELTIKETFFFRFAEQFAALRTTILPDLIAARGERKRLRIWSAGCSTGAEPYSVAVVLSDLLGPALGEWQISILGTDIDERALAAAREAVYGAWSLRTMATAERQRLFVDRDGRWRLRSQYSSMVRFERLNILDLDGSAVPLQFSDYDLVLCRNLLIYFHPDQAVRLVEALGARLAPDGWLLLGHAEAGLALGSDLVGVDAGGIVAYRQPEAVVPDAPPRQPDVRVEPTEPVSLHGQVMRATAPRAASTDPAAEPPAASITARVDEALDVIRQMLDSGEIDAASDAIAQLGEFDPESARLFFLAAVCALAREQQEVAERSLRAAIYLNGDFAMAHYLLAQLLLASRRTGAARRALVNAAKVLAAASPDDLVLDGDGRTAAELHDVIRARLSTIEAA